MSSVERSNSEHERDFPSNPETSSKLETSNSNRSSISDKPIQEQITSKEHEPLTEAIAENSSPKKSDLDNKSEWENLLSKLKGWIGPQMFANQFGAPNHYTPQLSVQYDYGYVFLKMHKSYAVAPYHL